ncbi:MAG: polysaccharide biosynthesis/export family protein [Gammaproteobacteria bacterium]|nr:polysaccharide biosynthesis/export family protein [Gammaproteobacteria bacterium]MBU1969720.1 polysaccharide biosynthesis/export family protein [Gammaproteobacteria bacterium]
MNRLFGFMLFLLVAFMNEGRAVAAENQEIYQLHQGDRVLISVWREATLQQEVVVLPDGSVTFPLIGRVEVAGLSTPEVEQRISAMLKKYIPDPIVTVVIVGIEGSRAYVTGKVLHPGSLIINGPITVLQAISLVGGLDRFADESGIKVIRATLTGQEILPVSYKDIVSGKNVSTNIKLKPGDTLVVP